jgi:hypothetical protein
MSEQLKRSLDAVIASQQQNSFENKTVDNKLTPYKEKMKKNGDVCPELEPSQDCTNRVITHGQNRWCASNKQCKNTICRAKEQYICNGCLLFVHLECTVTGNSFNNGAHDETLPTICFSCGKTEMTDDDTTTAVSGNYYLHYLDNDIEDPFLMENNTDEGTQDMPVQKTDTNLSFHVITEDKTDMVEKILSSIEKITNMMTDNYVHALANITGTVIKFNDIDPSIRQNMFSQIKSKLLSCDMDVRALHGQRFKIFAKWLHIVLPKGKLHKNLEMK